MASPDIIGVTHGASLAAVAVIVLGGSGDLLGGVASIGVPIAALLGGLAAALLVYVLSYRRGLVGYRLVLIGIGIGAVMTAVRPVHAHSGDDLRSGAGDGLADRVAERAQLGTRPAGRRRARSCWCRWRSSSAVSCALLEMGDDAAKGLGVRVERSRLALILCAVGLAALATASAGPIAFVAFFAPVIARRVVGSGQVALVPSALMGSVVVLASDLIARRILAPTELPVGIVTSIIGAPYLLYLLWTANRIGRGG